MSAVAPPGPLGDPASPVHRIDARAKLAGLTGVTLVAVSAPASAWPVWAGCAVVLAGAASVARMRPGALWRRARAALPPVVLVALVLPFTRSGRELAAVGPVAVTEAGLVAAASVAVKVTIGTLAAIVLAGATAPHELFAALRRLGAPRLFVLVAQVTWRYVPVAALEVRRTRTALAARGYAPRTALHADALGRAAGALFVRSHARAERLHLAMVARGFRGELPVVPARDAGAPEAVFLAATLGTVAVLRVLHEVLA